MKFDLTMIYQIIANNVTYDIDIVGKINNVKYRSTDKFLHKIDINHTLSSILISLN